MVEGSVWVGLRGYVILLLRGLGFVEGPWGVDMFDSGES